jgi:hypothetical protein
MVPTPASAKIPKDATQIIVKGLTFLEACNGLLDNGYMIDRKDNDLMTVTTKPVAFPKYWNANYTINVRVKDSLAIFTGNGSATPLIPYFNMRNRTNSKGQSQHKYLETYPFLIMDKVARSFGREVEYR